MSFPKIKKSKCTKCGVGLFLGLYIERESLFGRTKKYCYDCFNKSRFCKGKLESIDKDGTMLIKQILNPKKNNKDDVFEFRFNKKYFCKNCKEPIILIEYLARKIEHQNELCFVCTKKKIKTKSKDD